MPIRLTPKFPLCVSASLRLCVKISLQCTPKILMMSNLHFNAETQRRGDAERKFGRQPDRHDLN